MKKNIISIISLLLLIPAYALAVPSGGSLLPTGSTENGVVIYQTATTTLNSTRGSDGSVLVSTATSTQWVATSSLGIISGGTPGGSTTQVQFNNNGAFAGDSGLTFASSTNLLTVGGNVYADQFRGTWYASTAAFSGITQGTASTQGRLKLIDSSGANFDMLQFGGTTSSFPAIQRSSADISIRKADNSGYTGLNAGKTTITDSSGSGSALTVTGTADGGYGTRGYIRGVSNSTGNTTFIFGDAGGADYSNFYLLGDRNNAYGGFGGRLFEFIGMDRASSGDLRRGGFIMEAEPTNGYNALYQYYQSPDGEKWFTAQDGGWGFNVGYNTTLTSRVHIKEGLTLTPTTETVTDVYPVSYAEDGMTSSSFLAGTVIDYQAYSYKTAGDATTFYGGTPVSWQITISNDYYSTTMDFSIPFDADGVRVIRQINGGGYAEYADFTTGGTYVDDNENNPSNIDWLPGNTVTPSSPYSWGPDSDDVLRTDSGDVRFFPDDSTTDPTFLVDSTNKDVFISPRLTVGSYTASGDPFRVYSDVSTLARFESEDTTANIKVENVNEASLEIGVDTSDNGYLQSSSGQISLKSDTVFVGDGVGLPYGNMYMYEGSTTITISSANTWYEITTGMTGGEENLMTFQNNHEIYTSKAGRYLANWSLSITNGANTEIMGGIFVNGTAVNKSAGHGTVVSANKFINVSGNTILNLSAGDVVSLGVQNEDSATDITVEHATLTLTQIGG